MKSIREILSEKRESDDEKKKLVFVETDPNSYFPDDTISALERDIHKKAKDLEVEWKGSAALVDAAFESLDVPKPMAYQKNRWEQYKSLLGVAMRRLYEARGFKASWVNTV